MPRSTHHCNALRLEHVDQTVNLAGWVNSYRDHGGVIFIDLRDREGLSQIVFHPEHAEAHALADKLRNEDVIRVEGTCVAREEGMANPKLATGQIEVQAQNVEVLNKAHTPPFTPDDAQRVGEEIRLRYRYIDLRRSSMQQILRRRHRVTKIMRDYFDEHGFYEIETPFLCKSTPEGARDFLVPSRLQPGEFYALPQSPQLFKQILMAGGVERYVQIARCFRDEDPRADRQAEFTQLDLEMSFVETQDVMEITEGLVRRIWKQILDVDVPTIPHISWAEAMSKYGNDRPDLRFGMELVDISDLAAKTDFGVFTGTLNNAKEKGIVNAICVPGGGTMTRKETDGLAKWAQEFGAKGLAVTKVASGGNLETGIAKFLSPIAKELIERLGATEGDLLCFGADRTKVVRRVLGELRIKMARERDLIKQDQWKWLWVVDFPAVEWNETERRWDSLHHPFTAPRHEDLEQLQDHPDQVLSQAYDLVLNGSELGGGSIRIHQPEVQMRMFGLLGINEEEANQKFGFLLDALKHGTPPHGGIALGLDRLIMHLANTTNIRDVIAFPKTQHGSDLMTEAPSTVSDAQLRELHLRLALPPKVPAMAAKD